MDERIIYDIDRKKARAAGYDWAMDNPSLTLNRISIDSATLRWVWSYLSPLERTLMSDFQRGVDEASEDDNV